jgi:serine/threonine-protein kinase RsbW
MGGHLSIRLEFTSTFEAIDFVQVVSDQVGRDAGLDDDSVHWMGVAIRESVINAIRHGNQGDVSKRVFVDFDRNAVELRIRVRDQGDGFDPETVSDPLAPENLLKASGRGIFLIRSFMDDLRLQRASEGGMEVLMIKRVPQSAGSVQS